MSTCTSHRSAKKWPNLRRRSKFPACAESGIASTGNSDHGPDLVLEPRDPRPLYVQVADQFAEAIASGRLKPGDRLPSIRALSRTLGCALVTVSQAYDMLTARGRAVSRSGSGTFVTQVRDQNTPFARRWEPEAARFAQAERMEGAMEQLTRATAPGAINLATGHPAPETFPLQDFGRAFHRTLLDDPPELMQYRSTTGDADLCESLAALLRGRRCNAAAENIIVCSGAQQAADLVATVLLEPGSVVASESPTYSGTLGVFDARGVRYAEILSDGDGVRPDDCERVFAEYRPRLIYVNPIAQNPTGAVLSQRRAKQIVALARRYDVVILEDQTGWQLTYDAAAPAPLAAFDTDGRVIVMESLSKSIFPALRIGYLYCKGALAQSLELAKARTDVFTSTLTQRALWRFMSGNGYGRHLRSTRALYRERRDAFVENLAAAIPWSDVRRPAAGLNVWLNLPPRISTQAAFDACARRGVLVMPAEPFYPTRQGPPALRLSFGNVPTEEARTGLARIGDALA